VRPTLSVLIVAWNSREELARTLPALLPELGQGDERIVRSDRNTGFAAGCNEGAARARGDLLVVLNPDAAPRRGFGEAIRRPWLEGRGWAAWQALVADGDGATINSAGNPVHFTGIVWAGGHGLPIEQAPPADEVAALSGACLAIPRRTWEKVGGFPVRFFLYHEDVDLSLRLRLAGGALGIEPTAIVDHDYEFGARKHKWRWLERNRWAFLIRVYPASLLALLAPALILTELALIPASIAAGWGRQKLVAIGEVVRWLPGLLRERRQVQATRTITTAEFASWLTPDLDSPFIPAPARSFPARLVLRSYWRAVRLLLR
jgi:GT2 family glycosyltransferase